MALILGVFALLASRAAGQVSEFENQRIVDIQFSPARILDASDLAKAMPLKRGEPLRAEDVAKAIDGLFATGRVTDVVVEAERSGDGVIVHFVLQPAWFVGGLVVEGKVASPPNRAGIAGTAQLTLGAPFHDDDVTQAVNSIKKTLTANGLYEAEVTPELVRDADAQQIFVTIKINEHKRARYEMPIIHAAASVQDATDGRGSADRAGAVNVVVAARNTELADSTIVRATGWRFPLIHWWRQVTDARTRKGLQGVLAKYQKQDRLTAHVDLEKLDYDAQRRRVRPTLSVAPGPTVKVKAMGAKVSHGALKKYVPVFQERAVNNDLLAEGKRNLRDYFQSKGYYDVDVDIHSSPPENDLETIEYVISRGQRYKLVHLSFTGNRYFDDDTLRERMFMQPASFSMRHGRYSEAFRRKDEENITNLYRANGFRDVKVTSVVDRSYQDKAGRVAVTVNVEEGPQWLVDNVALNGLTQLKREDLIQRLASASGQPFAEVNLASDRNQILTYCYARGFPDADAKVVWEPSGPPHHVNVTYTVTEGDRQYVRDVIVSGVHTTRRSLVDKYITLKPGDPLSPIEEADIQQRLYDLGVFARVDTAVQNPGGDTNRKYILYNFEEANRYVLGMGVGAQVARFGTPSSSSLRIARRNHRH